MGDVKEFRKKPVVIQAIQWDGTLSGMDEILSVFTDIRTVAKTSHPPTNTCSFWKIGTLEGSHEVSAHDFVIRGVKGEYYPCKPDIFFMTYEPATTTPPADAALADESVQSIEACLEDDAGELRILDPDCEIARNMDEAAALIRQQAAALRARTQVPDGFVMVPVKPTEEMLSVAVDNWSGYEEESGRFYTPLDSDVRILWKALLAASKEDGT